jgi:hypothetical protein
MTILSRIQEGGDFTYETHYGYTPESINPVVASAEFVLKVSTNTS